MQINVAWDNNDHRIVRIVFQRGWTWQDLHQAVHQADQLITSETHIVHLVIDIHDAGGIPGDFISRAGELFEQGDARSNEGQKIVIGAGTLIKIAYKGFLKVYGSKLAGRPFIFADNLDEARDMLAEPLST
ncbi:MAG: hypothetical protein GC179_26530 [Anaerolineaceae bacterium]|nr:hypothetical protein [Anaerolineaceae bacterium]